MGGVAILDTRVKGVGMLSWFRVRPKEKKRCRFCWQGRLGFLIDRLHEGFQHKVSGRNGTAAGLGSLPLRRANMAPEL